MKYIFVHNNAIRSTHFLQFTSYKEVSNYKEVSKNVTKFL